MTSALDQTRIDTEFRRAVNMTAAELSQWLETDTSKDVGWKGSDGKLNESVGHASGRRIVALLRKDPSELTAADYAHMRKVSGYIRRHLAQEPANIVTSRWRYSLMNWGRDPLKALQPSDVTAQVHGQDGSA